jgi:hypothetical protein
MADTIAGIRIPDSKLAREAADLLRCHPRRDAAPNPGSRRGQIFRILMSNC